jgi:radical SAM family uncharacterized protein
MLDDILLQVQKPARYIGQEWNLPKKDFAQSNIKFALCFPDLYEVGMSNLGIRIIYSILNSIPDVSCERFFSCGLDMEQILRSKHLEVFSLESKKRLREFDIIGFSLGCELNYTNVLNILELGGIPLKSSLRTNREPLVIAGGPAALNPEPMHEFFDLFIIGEGEDLILEFIELYRKYKEKYKRSEISKQDLLFMFANISGVYVPSFYKVRYNPQGGIEEFKPEIEAVAPKINKRFVKDLNSSFFPLDWLLPYIQIVHDRITLEIMRGCPNRCRFCQARSAYFPLRLRGIENILNLARATYKRTGYEEISLGGLSVSDYANIEELLQGLIDLFKEKAVGVSLPSIKARAGVGNLSYLIAKIKKTGLTFAPESGSERLRKILGKDFDEQDFFKTIEQAYTAGYRHLKLYFMIGLPFEEQRDLDDIVEFAIRTSELRRQIKKVPAQVNISINALIPKPHTPLQWFGMIDIDTLKYKQNYLKNKIRNKRLILTFHNRYMSFLEGVLSRGDRRLSQVIFSAFKRGARFDAWGDGFAFEKWQAAFAESNIDPRLYLKEKSPDELLPWDFIDVGISKDALVEEFNKVIATE